MQHPERSITPALDGAAFARPQTARGEGAPSAWVTPLPTAVSVLPGASLRAALTWGAHGLAHLEHCEQLPDAERMLAQRQAFALFTRRHDADGNDLADVIARLRAVRPSLAVIVVEPPGTRSSAPAPAGLYDAVLHEDSGSLRDEISEVLAVVRRTMRRRRMATELARAVATRLQGAVRTAIERGERPQSIRELAAAVGVPRKTLDRWLGRTSTLTARQLLGWGRLLAVAMRLEDEAVKVSTVTDELGFASPSALRNLLQRYVGLTPTQLREAGGADFLFGRLRDEIARGASATPSQAEA